MTNTIEFLRRVRTVRRFRPDPVPDEAVDDIIKVARWTGSARNLQPWDLIVVRDPAVRQALAQAGGNVAQVADSPVAIVIALRNREGLAEQETFDEGRLCERIMMAAAAHGLGSGIAWFAGEGRENARKLLNIPEGRLVRTVVAIGYAQPSEPSGRPKIDQPRKPVERLVHRERYEDRRTSS